MFKKSHSFHIPGPTPEIVRNPQKWYTLIGKPKTIYTYRTSIHSQRKTKPTYLMNIYNTIKHKACPPHVNHH